MKTSNKNRFLYSFTRFNYMNKKITKNHINNSTLTNSSLTKLSLDACNHTANYHDYFPVRYFYQH